MKKSTALALGVATFLALAAPAFAAPPASTAPAAPAASSAAPARTASAGAAATSANRRMTPAEQLVSRAQTKLKQDSLYSGPINGRRDHATVQAIRSFQTQHHLTVNGRLDAKTRRALGI